MSESVLAINVLRCRGASITSNARRDSGNVGLPDRSSEGPRHDRRHADGTRCIGAHRPQELRECFTAQPRRRDGERGRDVLRNPYGRKLRGWNWRQNAGRDANGGKLEHANGSDVHIGDGEAAGYLVAKPESHRTRARGPHRCRGASRDYLLGPVRPDDRHTCTARPKPAPCHANIGASQHDGRIQRHVVDGGFAERRLAVSSEGLQALTLCSRLKVGRQRLPQVLVEQPSSADVVTQVGMPVRILILVLTGIVRHERKHMAQHSKMRQPGRRR